jgi:hypothetical protein
MKDGMLACARDESTIIEQSHKLPRRPWFSHFCCSSGGCALVFLITFLSQVWATPDLVDQLGKSVVNLQMFHPIIDTVVENGNTNNFEIWWKYPGTNVFKPKFQTAVGTGFLLRHGPATYIVTAKHVAGCVNCDGIYYLV